MILNLPNNLLGFRQYSTGQSNRMIKSSYCPILTSPFFGFLNTRSNSSATELNVGIGGASLVDLHNQILTLKETIMSLESMIKDDDSSVAGDKENVTLEASGFERCAFEAEDFSKLQEEYNKLIFQKHQV